MSMIRPSRPAEDAAAANTPKEVEGELGELIRRDVAPLRRPQLVEQNGEAAVGQVTSAIDRVSVASVKEVEKLIAELEHLRDFLQAESQRVQREITGYAQMSQSAMSSTKIMAESVGKWKAAIEAARKPVAAS